jgi:hypothetical protein
LQVKAEPASIPGEVNKVRTAPALLPVDASPHATPDGSEHESHDFTRMLTKTTTQHGFDVSSDSDEDSGDDEETELDPKNMQEEDLEAAAQRKSAKKVQEWLKTDYQQVVHLVCIAGGPLVQRISLKHL